MVSDKIDYWCEIRLFYCRRKERSVAKGDKIDASDRRLSADELAVCVHLLPAHLFSATIVAEH